MISNSITAFRLVLTIPLFLLLMLGGPGWTALGLFLAAGALDILDGKLARRLGEVSEFGGMLDLIGDRMLTLAAVAGLLAAGALSVWAAAFAIVLAARCIFVASFGEAFKGRIAITPSKLEPVKIAFAFAGLGLAMVPGEAYPDAPLSQAAMTAILLGIAAALTAITVIGYWRAAVRGLSLN